MKRLLFSLLCSFSIFSVAHGADRANANPANTSIDPALQIEQPVDSAPLAQELLSKVPSPAKSTAKLADDPYYRSQVLMKSEGTVIAEGQNVAPVGDFKVQSYRLEEINLPEAWNVKIRNADQLVNKAWRFKLLGGHFQVADTPYIVWLENTILGYGDAADEGLVTYVFDKSMLVDGATISVSAGEKGVRTKLPEKLVLRRSPD